MQSIAICITSFNRRSRTLACLRRIYGLELPGGTSLRVHLLDDASSDGTADAVAVAFPQVQLHHGDGAHYWAGGMRIAYAAALAEGHDYYVWLNDDVELFSDAMVRALSTLENLRSVHGGEHVIVGAMCDRERQGPTYSGYSQPSRLFPWKLRKLPPLPDRPRECFTLNGNFVLIPSEIAHKIGNIDPAYIQMHADLALGILARRNGARNWILPGFVGVCELNVSGRKDWTAPGLSISERFKRMEHPLGFPLRPNLAYSRHFKGWAPIVVAAPYLGLIRAALSDVKSAFRR
ncbi:glycosyltransferase family 2 protein [Bradyrhizobium sp. GCM10028915]|uniref:glycosyltransferase family 2 protein n=1 Tax=Bradyrhizobium sp. GCM10028915 TaxID=3273385 RepID=UPI00361D40C0